MTTHNPRKPFKFFFGASADHVLGEEKLYARIINSVKKQGGEITRDWISGEAKLQRSESAPGDGQSYTDIYSSVMTSIRDADLVIFEVSQQSMSIGHQLTYALERAKPTLVLYHAKHKSTEHFFIEGARSGYITFGEYQTEYQLDDIIVQFITKHREKRKTRINLALDWMISDYLEITSNATGKTKTAIIQDAIRNLMEQESEYILHNTTKPYLDVVRAHTKPYTAKVHGKEIIVYPHVMSPAYDWTSHFVAGCLGDMSNKKVLDMGCGTGVLGLFAFDKGARHVTFTDINTHAIANTKENLKNYRFTSKDYAVVESDSFDKISSKEKFDTIILTSPFHGTKPADILEAAVADEGYKFLKKFFSQIDDHLTKDSDLYVAFSDTGDLKLLRNLFDTYNFQVFEKWEKYDEKDDWTCIVFHLKKR